MTKWSGTFALRDRVKIAVSGEEGIVVGIYIDGTCVVRYCRADGVAVEQAWAADALMPADDTQVVALRAVA